MPYPLFFRHFFGTGPDCDAFADLPRRVRHGAHNGLMFQAADLLHTGARNNGQNQSLGANALQALHHFAETLRFHREHDHIRM